jgi:hypothetical protein
MKRAADARGQGFGDQAGQIERNARRKQIEAIQEEARNRAGLNDPFADLKTNSERLASELAAIKDTYQKGGYGAAGSGGAQEIMKRQVGRALDQYGNKAPEAVQPRFEGLQDMWQRIQESAAGKSNDPQEQAVQELKANKGVLEKVFGETQASKISLGLIADKIDKMVARAG